MSLPANSANRRKRSQKHLGVVGLQTLWKLDQRVHLDPGQFIGDLEGNGAVFKCKALGHFLKGLGIGPFFLKAVQARGRVVDFVFREQGHGAVKA